ncbi:MAG: PEP-CTERM sorting domain-containing protein [Rubripirellula sp.]|nr:PEP-CTERM sorting domain-containing protein [Rubripirellula sp.]
MNNSSPLCLAALLVAIVNFGEKAEGGIIYNVTNFTASGGDFTEIFSASDVTGTLTGVEVDLVFTDSNSVTWGSDFTVLVYQESDLKFQAGGYTDQDADERLTWANGNSANDGTEVKDALSLLTSLAAPLSISIGNGYNFGGNGTWNGTLTLVGLDEVSNDSPAPTNVVPEPSSLAIFTLALGMVGTLRRRRDANV